MEFLRGIPLTALVTREVEEYQRNCLTLSLLSCFFWSNFVIEVDGIEILQEVLVEFHSPKQLTREVEEYQQNCLTLSLLSYFSGQTLSLE